MREYYRLDAVIKAVKLTSKNWEELADQYELEVMHTATGVMLCDGASGIAGQVGDDWMLVYPNGTVTFYAGEYFRKHWREA